MDVVVSDPLRVQGGSTDLRVPLFRRVPRPSPRSVRDPRPGTGNHDSTANEPYDG